MFPRPQVIKEQYPVSSASRDPEGTGARLARKAMRNTIFFTVIGFAALADVWQPGLGSPYWYGVAAMASLIPLLATVF